MTQHSKNLSAAGRYRAASDKTATNDDTSVFWKHCTHFSAILIAGSLAVVAVLYSGDIAATSQEAYFFVLRSIGQVSNFAAAMLP